MKKLLFIATVCSTLVLSGCFETTQEITLNEDGSGTISNTNNLGALLGLLKQMGGTGDLEKADQQKIDSTFSLAAQADSITSLTPEEKEIAKKGIANIKMNLKEETLSTNIKFPFSSLSEIATSNKVAAKILTETIKSQMAGMPMDGGGGDMPEASSFDDYYTLTFSKGVITKTLNKEKYAKVADDEYFKTMKEAGGMGLTMKTTYIINLPRPAKKVEGAGVTLSDDKKKVTVAISIDDFFEEAAKYEFRIEY